MMLYFTFILVGIGGMGWILYQILHKRSLRRNIQASLEQTFIDVTHVLNAHQIPFFLDYGTLLGYYRDACIMPHEYDVDLSISHLHTHALQQALRSLPKGYYMKKPKQGNFQNWNGYSVKICYKNRPGNLDIYIYYPFKETSLCQGKACKFNNGHVIECIPKDGFGKIETNLIFPLQLTSFNVNGLLIPCYIPHRTRDYITHLYGSNLKSDMVGLLGNRLFIRQFWG